MISLAEAEVRSRPLVSRYFLIRQFFSAGYGYRPYRSGEYGIRIRNFFNPSSRVEIFESAMYAETCGR